ncbi:arylsulfatase [Maribacter sp. 2210JD10-5]|uniref:arylsulfatase n=1 Tax=Maribacter sp. 2210JD10-5 TaxID=3386272 RepID=UPI0039BD8358
MKKKSLILLTVLAISCAGNNKKEIEKARTQPNIIIILTDDQGYGDIGHHGNPIIKTPHLDEFAKNSLELTNFHVGTTCAPTRAAIMTGRNANRNNAWHTIAGCSILLDDEETMPEVFQRNGYATSMLGKWHLGDNYPFRPQDRGFEEAFYLGGGGVQQTPDYWNNDYFDDTYFRNGIPEKTNGYCTDVWFNEAIAYTKTRKDQPFFMYLALNAAHSPFNVPEEYAKMYASAPLDEVQKRFYGMISNIDDNFGKLVAHLKATDQFDNTIIVFTSDNGTAGGFKTSKTGEVLGYNGGLRGVKASHYEGGHRVPFFISWPDGDIQQETTNNDLMAHVDLLPTLAHLADIPFSAKKTLDGTNMAATLKGKKDADRMLIIDTQRNQLPEKYRNPSVMDGEWRLVNNKELYDLREDIGQQNDVAEQYPERVKKMQAFYESWWKSIQSDIKYAEIPLGYAEANPVMVTIHDMHTTKDYTIPWNQVQIREGESYPDGYYSITVKEDGRYRFKLYRYPPESKLALNATTEEIPATAYTDALPKGKVFDFSSAEVVLGDVVLNGKVDAEEDFVILEGDLQKGSYKLRSNFKTADNKLVPAYFTQIEKL